MKITVLQDSEIEKSDGGPSCMWACSIFKFLKDRINQIQNKCGANREYEELEMGSSSLRLSENCERFGDSENQSDSNDIQLFGFIAGTRVVERN